MKKNKVSSERRDLVLFFHTQLRKALRWPQNGRCVNILRTRNQTGSIFTVAAGLSVDNFSVFLRRLFSSFAFASGTYGD